MNTLEKPLVVNLYGGPGTGKSSCMATIFSELKWMGINCEMTPEFAKEKVWEESIKVLDDQVYVFGKQAHKMNRLVGKVDVIVTDSPLLFSIMYDVTKNKSFKKLVGEVYYEFNNIDFLLKREKAFEAAGRLQNEMKARELDEQIEDILEEHSEAYATYNANKENAIKIANIVALMLNEEKLKNL